MHQKWLRQLPHQRDQPGGLVLPQFLRRIHREIGMGQPQRRAGRDLVVIPALSRLGAAQVQDAANPVASLIGLQVRRRDLSRAIDLARNDRVEIAAEMQIGQVPGQRRHCQPPGQPDAPHHPAQTTHVRPFAMSLHLIRDGFAVNKQQ